MLEGLKKVFWKGYSSIDSSLKFPMLKKEGIGVQCGFDMDSPSTSDLFLMCRKVGAKGKVYGIDPDPTNHEVAKQVIQDNLYPCLLLQCAISDKEEKSNLRMGSKRGWNQLTSIPLDSTVEFQEKEISVAVKSLPQIFLENEIEFEQIDHINLTINGFEYHALKGMEELLKTDCKLSLTIIAGRYDETGTINGQADHELILDLLHACGFKTRFRRIEQIFWWSFITKLLVNRQFVFGKKNYGVIFAVKGTHKIPWYQSFS